MRNIKLVQNRINGFYEEEGQIVLEVKSNRNNYIYNKKLYLDKETGNPTKLTIEDVNEKNIVYIEYNEIKINALNNTDKLVWKNVKIDKRLMNRKYKQ